MITCTKRYDNFPFAHRQPNHAGHCSRIHGHNWSFEFEFACDIVDHNGFVVDFGGLKGLHADLERMFDHTLVLNVNDPLARDQTLRQFAVVNVVPNCGAEGLADFLFKGVNARLSCLFPDGAGRTARGLRVVRVTVFEDNRNSATAKA